MLWKFWTWFGSDNHDQALKNAGSRKQLKSSTEAGSSEPEDILMSITGLIEEQIEIDGEKQRRKIVGSTQNAESNAQPNDLSLTRESWSDVNPQNSVATESIALFETTKPESVHVQTPVVPSKGPSEAERKSAPIRVPSAPARAESQKDVMRTLTAEDGQWPMFKGLAGAFKDLEDDDDEPDGSSPFQTIVPKDD